MISIEKVAIDATTYIGCHVPYERKDWIDTIKTISGRIWHTGEKIWLIPYEKDSWTALQAKFPIELNVSKNPLRNISQQATPTSSVSTAKPTLSNDKISIMPSTLKGYLDVFIPKKLLPTHLEFVKNIQGRKYEERTYCWQVPCTQLTIRFFESFLKDVIHWTFALDISTLPEQHEIIMKVSGPKKDLPKAKFEVEIEAMEEVLLLKRYAIKTIKTYKNTLRSFFLFYDNINPKDITRKQIDAYVLHSIKNAHISESYQNTILSAIKFYYANVLEGQESKVENLLRPKMPQKLPQVLSESEVTRLLKSVDNLKHRCIMTLVYSAGLRLGEVINIKLNDIQIDMNRIFVRNAKGKKDRCTILSKKVLDLLNQYKEIYKPTYWLFEGQTGGKYSERSVQAIFEKAREKSGINPLSTTHTLRHSFATHLLLRGLDIHNIQKLLGHESSQTTEIYLHITKKGFDDIQSPFDHLDI